VTSVRLRPATLDDIAFCMAAERDPEARPFISNSDESGHRALVQSDERDYLIVESAGERAGFLIFTAVDENGTIELARLVIATRGAGLARQVLPLAIDHVFTTTDAHRFWLDVLPHNERARRAYARAGFVEEGILRDAWIGPNGTESLVIMSVLRPEWVARSTPGSS
jgi:RimJ/RimL family protein N-acetyltransferase